MLIANSRLMIARKKWRVQLDIWKGALYVIYMSDYLQILQVKIKLKTGQQPDLRVGKIMSKPFGVGINDD